MAAPRVYPSTVPLESASNVQVHQVRDESNGNRHNRHNRHDRHLNRYKSNNGHHYGWHNKKYKPVRCYNINVPRQVHTPSGTYTVYRERRVCESH